MNVVFKDSGAAATLTITSTVFEFRKHNRAVDAALFAAPTVSYCSKGNLIKRTVIFGKTVPVMRAFKAVRRELP